MNTTETIQSMHWADLATLAPELTLIVAAVLLSLIDLVLGSKRSREMIGVLSLVAVILSFIFVIMKMVSLAEGHDPAHAAQAVTLLGQSYRVDDFANLFKLCFLLGTGLIILMSLGNLREDEIQHKGEYYYLLLPAVVGAMMMSSSGDLITLFVGLELLSITSYILVGMKKNDLKSNESAFKYVVLGSIASAFILYGMSFLYGMTGTTDLGAMTSLLMNSLDSFHVLIYVSFFLMVGGFAFKIAAAPFHIWAPDVYQGAPTPVTAFLAVVSKAAGFAILFRIFYNVFFQLGTDAYPHMRGDLTRVILVIAAIAMIIGNTAALRQRNVKRLLALSGVANAGVLLIPLGSFNVSNFAEFIYYLVAYLFMNIGALAITMVVERSTGRQEVSSFAGLYYRAPLTAVAMTMLLLSFAGIPLTGGFIGKLFIALGAAQSQHYWIIVILLLSSVISLYYYFGIVRQMYMRTMSEEAAVRVPVTLGITIWLCVAATIVLGVMPNALTSFINYYFSIPLDLFVNFGS